MVTHVREFRHRVSGESSLLIVCSVSITLLVGCQVSSTEDMQDVGQIDEEMSTPPEMRDMSRDGHDMMVMQAEHVVSQDVPHSNRSVWCVPARVNVESIGADGSLWGEERSSGELGIWQSNGVEPELFDPGVHTTRVRAWSTSAVAIAAKDRLFTWRREHGERSPLYELRAPFDGAMIQALCGDPEEDGSFVVARGLYERAGGQWWRVRSPLEEFDHTSLRLADLAGECTGRDGWLWAFDEHGVYQIGQDESLRHEAADQLAIDPGLGVVARRGDRLEAWRPEQSAWREIMFDSGPVHQLAGTAGHVWLVAGQTLYHEDERGLVQLVLDGVDALNLSESELHVDPVGGAWLVFEDELCRVQPEVDLGIRGLRPYQRTTQAMHRLTLDVASRVTLDGEVIHEGDGEVLVTFASQGWHLVEIEALATQHRQVFDIWRQVERVPNWEEDIEQIAITSCGAGTCHGGEQDIPGQPRLVTYEEWVQHAPAIENRVGRVGDMPPARAREGWMTSDASTVLAWLRGGLKHRSEGSDD